jgi:hypothetical protein
VPTNPADMTPIIAVITVVPGTIAAIGAWRNSRQANNAVNHRKEGEPTLVRMVERMDKKIDRLGESVHHLAGRFEQHCEDGEKHVEN